MNTSERYIPPQLESVFGERERAIHDSFAERHISDFRRTMPQLETWQMDEGGVLRYAEIPAGPDANSASESLVVALPYASGWSVNRYIRSLLTSEIADESGRRVIILPGTSVGQQTMALTKEQRERVAYGDISPITENDVRLLGHLGIGSIAMVGYSFGAMRTAALAARSGDVVVEAAGVFDAPNSVARVGKELQDDFSASGLPAFVESVREAGIPALSEAFGVGEHTKQLSPQIIKDLARFAISTLIAENPAIRQAMSRATLFTDMRSIVDAGVPILVANASQSRIMPSYAIETLRAAYGDSENVRLMTVDGKYGHEMGDNVLVHALLARLAIVHS